MIKQLGEGFSIEVEIVVKAGAEMAWSCFMDPKKSAEFFFGIGFESDLQVGGPIVWRGEWQGSRFEDRGIILEIEEPRVFRYDYVSSMAPDTQYEVAYYFEQAQGGTRIRIAQSKAATRESAEHSEKNWSTMLAAIKEKLESPA
jgi:Uncharacterized conserved protein